MTEQVDAVVVGGGHNGLVAGAHLADAGWDVVVLEASHTAGGAVRSTRAVGPPGFTTDLFSAFYPMTAASPIIAGLGLEDHGLRWRHAPKVLAHLVPGGTAAVLHRDPERTAQGIDAVDTGDGAPWREMSEQWERFGPAMMRALFSPFPPVRAAARLARDARLDLWDLARLVTLPVRTLGAELFSGTQARLLLSGNALHADVTPESTPSALLGWLLVNLGQTVGFPVPEGGAGAMSAAMVSRFAAAGGSLRTGSAAERIEVRGGRAVGVHTVSGYVAARRAVLAACDAEVLYDRLLTDADLPDAFLARMRQFHRATSTVKVNYALSAPVPWTDRSAEGAGTVHIADSVEELTMTAAELSVDRIPARPFLLIGQMTTSDPSRSPEGTESMWVYTHVPQDIRGDAGGSIGTSGRLRGAALTEFVERMEARIEANAPGFRSRVLHRDVQGPDDLEAANPSLVGGDISGGTAQLHQQLVFRPVPGLARPETPVRGLYLASSSAHPGGSVHGACGANAARAALLHARARTWAPFVAGVGVPVATLAAARRRSR